MNDCCRLMLADSPESVAQPQCPVCKTLFVRASSVEPAPEVETIEIRIPLPKVSLSALCAECRAALLLAASQAAFAAASEMLPPPHRPGSDEP